MSTNPVDNKVDNSIACIFTMMLPGLGQMLKNQIIPGIVWSVVVGGGYLLNGWFGLGVHVLCILDAALVKEEKSQQIKGQWLQKTIMFSGLSLLILYTCFRTALF